MLLSTRWGGWCPSCACLCVTTGIHATAQVYAEFYNKKPFPARAAFAVRHLPAKGTCVMPVRVHSLLVHRMTPMWVVHPAKVEIETIALCP